MNPLKVEHMEYPSSVYSHGGSQVSYYSNFSSRSMLESYYRGLHKELVQSRVSQDQTLSLSEITAASSLCDASLRSRILSDDVVIIRGESLLPLIQTVERYCKKLCEIPTPNEKLCLAAMQSLWNILRALNKEPKMPCRNTFPACAEEKVSFSFVASLTINQGVIPALSCVMKTHRDSRKVQSRAILLLSILGEDNKEYQDVIAECHGVSYILAAMLHPQHSKSSRFCLDACESLASITSMSPRGLYQLAHGDGVRTLHCIMRLYYKKYAIQECCLRLLSQLAKHSPPSKRAQFRDQKKAHNMPCQVLLETLEDPELIEFVVHIISRHRKLKHVLLYGGSFLHELAIHGTLRTRSSLVWSKAVPMIVKVSKAFLSHATIQMDCFETLWALCKERPEARDMAVEDGCVFLFEAMLAHLNHTTLPEKACMLLCLLCSYRHTCSPVIKCFRKNAKYRKALLTIEEMHPVKCGDLVNRIITFLSL